MKDLKFLCIIFFGITLIFLACSEQENNVNSELGDMRATFAEQNILPAVMVSADYVIPKDYVDNTGAYIPQNGKPTIVFVDSIW